MEKRVSAWSMKQALTLKSALESIAISPKFYGNWIIDMYSEDSKKDSFLQFQLLYNPLFKSRSRSLNIWISALTFKDFCVKYNAAGVLH
jgi:hypothetical protein